MEVPTINLPDAVQIETVEIPLPTADVPYYIPMVVPPSDLRDQEAKPVKTEEKVEPPAPVLNLPPLPPIPIPPTEVLVPTVITAVTAVAATTVATPIIQDLKERITKFLNNKIKKWKENRKKKRDSLQNSKKT